MKTTPEAIRDLTTVVGGSAPPVTLSTVEALKQLYVAMGGDAAEVANISTIPDAIEIIASVSSGGGGGGYEEMLRGVIEGTINSLEIPNGTKNIRYNAFAYIRELQTVTIPDSVTRIEESAFEGCDGVGWEGIIIPDSVTTIDSRAFKGCNSIRNIKLSNNLTIIQAYTFEGCSWLSALTIPDSVTQIYDYAFKDCLGLKTVILPASIEYMGDDPFYGCTRIENIYCGFSEGAVSGAPWGATNATIVYDYTPT